MDRSSHERLRIGSIRRCSRKLSDLGIEKRRQSLPGIGWLGFELVEQALSRGLLSATHIRTIEAGPNL
jgi:hypothetical protein